MNNKDKFLNLVSEKDSKALENIKWRKENREWLRKSQAIAIKILTKLKENKAGKLFPSTQVQLAEQLNVSAQQVNKWLRGKENFTLETISKLEAALSISILDITKQPRTEISALKTHTESLTYSTLEKAIFSKRTKGKIISLRQKQTTPFSNKTVQYA